MGFVNRLFRGVLISSSTLVVFLKKIKSIYIILVYRIRQTHLSQLALLLLNYMIMSISFGK